MIVDTHIHIIVPEITRGSADLANWRPQVYWADGKQVVEFSGREIKAAVREFVEVERMIDLQAQVGIDRSILSPWVSILGYELDPEKGLEISRIQNEALVSLANRFPEKLSVLGTVPLQDPDLAAEELERLMNNPGVCGVEVAASVNGVYLGDRRFWGFWSAAQALDAFVFIHPTTRGLGVSAFSEYYLWNTVGNPLETTIAASHMIMSGLMEDLPDLKVLLAHGGGAILGLRGRLNHAYTFQPQAREKLQEPPVKALRRFYFDTVVHDLNLLNDLIDFAGADRVLLGSDYPFDMGTERPLEPIQALDLPVEEETRILGGNAARLLHLEES